MLQRNDAKERFTMKDNTAKMLMKIVDVPISMIQREASPAPDKGFVKDIKERGVLQPVCLTPGLGNKYKIIWGRRRIDGAELAGLTSVPAIIKEDVDNIDVLILIENHQRSSNIGIELKAVRGLIKKGLDLQEIAGLLNLRVAKLKRIYRLDNLSDRWLSLLCSGHISEARALHIARLPKDKQEFVLSEYGHEVDPKEIQAVIREVNLDGAQTLFSGIEQLPQFSPLERKLDELINMVMITGKVELNVLSAFEVLRNFVSTVVAVSPKSATGGINHDDSGIAKEGLWEESAGGTLRDGRNESVRSAA
jgi:ParB/RepB/Spo0J family partition protein